MKNILLAQDSQLKKLKLQMNYFFLESLLPKLNLEVEFDIKDEYISVVRSQKYLRDSIGISSKFIVDAILKMNQS